MPLGKFDELISWRSVRSFCNDINPPLSDFAVFHPFCPSDTGNRGSNQSRFQETTCLVHFDMIGTLTEQLPNNSEVTTTYIQWCGILCELSNARSLALSCSLSTITSLGHELCLFLGMGRSNYAWTFGNKAAVWITWVLDFNKWLFMFVAAKKL